MVEKDNVLKIVGIPDMKDKILPRALFAEFLGTFFLVLIGIFSVAGDTSVVQIAFTFGLTVAAFAQAIGHVSGCHINPAVTMGFCIVGEMSILKGIFYIICQLLGAGLASLALKFVISDELQGEHIGASEYAPSLAIPQAMAVEFFITFMLVLVVKAVSDPYRKDITGSAPLAVGLTVTTGHLAAIHLSGASMNPARTFGPSLVFVFWTEHYIYWAGPIFGGILAGIVYRFVFQLRDEESDS